MGQDSNIMVHAKTEGNWEYLVCPDEINRGKAGCRIPMACRYVICAVSDLKLE